MFSVGLGKYILAKTIFQLKENAVPLFKSKRSVPFVALEPINKKQ